MFTKQAQKAIEKGRSYATIRRDTAIKAIQSNSFSHAVCDFHYTDDYAYDNATGFGKGNVSAEAVLNDLDFGFSNIRCYINVKDSNRLHVSIHSNLSYSVYFKQQQTISTPKNSTIETTSNNNESNNYQSNNAESFIPATPKQLFALYLASGKMVNTKDAHISKTQASDLIGRSKNGEDITDELKAIIAGEQVTNVEPTETIQPLEEQIQETNDNLIDTIADISTSFLSNNNILHISDLTNEQKPLYKNYMVEQLTKHAITIDNKLYELLASYGYNSISELLTFDPSIQITNESKQSEAHQEEQNKTISIKSITFLWSESNLVKDNTIVSTFKAANDIINKIASQNDRGYTKTKFIIEWVDGRKHEGRIDVEQKHLNKTNPIGEHVKYFYENLAGLRNLLPGHGNNIITT